MTVWLLISTLVALALLALAIRGRRVGDEPRCRKCKFDLSGQPDPGAGTCPECGAGLSLARATRRGLRKRRWLVLALGLVCLAPGGAWLGLFAYSASTTPGKQPTWYLLLRAEHGSIHGAGATLDEITKRHGAGEITARQYEPIVDRALAIMLDESIEWGHPLTDSWSEFCLAASNGRRMSPRQVTDFYRATYPLEVFPVGMVYEADEPRVRIGVRIGYERRTPTSMRQPAYRIRPLGITIGGVTAPVRTPPNSVVSIGGSSSMQGMAPKPSEWFVPAISAPGLHDMHVEFESLIGNGAATFVSSAKVRIVERGEAYQRAETDEAVETVKRHVMARVFMHNGFEVLADGRAPPADDTRPPAAFIELASAPSPVGGVFDVWLVTPRGNAVRLFEECVVPALRDGDRPFEGVHHHRSTTIFWQQSPFTREGPPFDPAAIPGERYRLVFEPSAHEAIVRSPHSQPMREDWAPPRTLTRRFTVPIEERVGVVARRIRERCFGSGGEFEPISYAPPAIRDTMLGAMMTTMSGAFARDAPGEYIWVPPPDDG